jgi:IS4 transposase
MDKNTLFSSFGKWIAPIYGEKFRRQIQESGQDKYVKKLTTTAYLLLFLHAQLESRDGLRDIAVVFQNEEDVFPEKVIITKAKPSDRTQMDVLIDETNATHVFDRGYVDYEKFDEYCDQGIFFITRLKKNAITRMVHSFRLPENSTILSDEMALVGTPQKRMDNYLRLVKTVDTKGNELLILTNRFDLEAEEISDMYRSRWAIELFFKWLKQHTKIKTFYGTSENAVTNQILIALIYYCLHLLIKIETKSTLTLLQLSRLLRSYLWKPYEKWLERIHYRPKRRSLGRQKKQ